MSMWKECEGLQEELVKMRRELHQIPEFRCENNFPTGTLRQPALSGNSKFFFIRGLYISYIFHIRSYI